MSREKRSAVAVVGVPSFFSFFFCYYELGHSWDSFNFLTCLPLFPNYFVLPFFFSANIDVNLTFLLFPSVTLFIYLFFLSITFHRKFLFLHFLAHCRIFFHDLFSSFSLDAGPPVILSPSFPPHHSTFPSIRDVIASHRAAIFSSPSLRVNLPIEISVGRGTEWSANRRRMMILLSSLATALFCGPRTSLAVIKLFTGPARLSFESRYEITRSHTIP